MGFDQLAYAQEFRDFVRQIVQNEVSVLRPDSQIGTVTTLDSANNRCFVQFAGPGETPVAVRLYTIRPSVTGATVRVEGKPGLKYVAEVLSGNAALNGVSTNFTPANYRVSDFGAPNKDVTWAGYRLTNLATPTATTDAATKAYADTKASMSHTHTIGDVTGLQAALDDKVSSAALASHTHTTAQVTGLDAALASKAPINNPTFTGTVNGVTKAMVGLGNVDNTSDVNKPISTAVQTALNLKSNTGHSHPEYIYIHAPSDLPPTTSNDGDYWIDTDNVAFDNSEVLADDADIIYTDGNMTSVVEYTSGTLLRTINMTYNSSNYIDTVEQVIGTETQSITLQYDSYGTIIGYTRTTTP